MDGHQGPAELEDAMRERGWPLAEATFKSKNLESGEEITYRLVVGENPQPLEEDPDAERRKELHWAKVKVRFRLTKKLLDPSLRSTKDQWLSDIEQLRECCRPDHVRLLFVGESPPASGDFFYLGNSKLYRSTAAALGWDEDWKEALSSFQDAGGYLIDLCHEPIDKLARPAKRAKRKEAEADLAVRLQSLAPDAIVIAMRDIEGNVRRAIAAAGLPESLPVFVVSFPAHGHQPEYIRDLREIAKELRFMQWSIPAG